MLRCPSRCLHRVIDGILLYEVGPVGLDLQLLEVFRPGFRQLPEVKFKGMLRCSSNVGAEVSPRDVLPGQIVLFVHRVLLHLVVRHGSAVSVGLTWGWVSSAFLLNQDSL